MYKNRAGQTWRVSAWNSTTGALRTGDAANITAKIRKDGGAPASLTDVHPVESTSLPGYYDFDLTQAETNASVIDIIALSGTATTTVMGEPSRYTTTTANLYDLMPQVSPYLATCPIAVQQQWLRTSAQRLCAETGIWRVTLDPIDTVVAEDTYALPLDAGDLADVQAITLLTRDGVPVYDSSFDALFDGTLLFNNADTIADQVLIASVVLRPHDNCVQYPDWLLTRYGSGIASGAVALLKSMDPKTTPWGDPNSAPIFYTAYRRAHADAASAVLTALKTQPSATYRAAVDRMGLRRGYATGPFTWGGQGQLW